jgi:hypothetical protein
MAPGFGGVNESETKQAVDGRLLMENENIAEGAPTATLEDNDEN